jgi:hypothetical protein
MAAFAWTAQLIFTVSKTLNLYLPAVELFFAENTKTLIIERLPSSGSIFHTQNRKSIVEFDMNNHGAKALCSLHRNRQSGRWMIV